MVLLAIHVYKLTQVFSANNESFHHLNYIRPVCISKMCVAIVKEQQQKILMMVITETESLVTRLLNKHFYVLLVCS